MTEAPEAKKRNLLSLVGPGILVAATGVGAGDMMTASLGGSALGVAILWAAVVGALFKWFLNEGIARWQMATGTTLLEGWVKHLGSWIQWLFIIYLLGWTFFTGGALVTACGVAGTGLFPLAEDPDTSKIIWGVIHSALGLGLVLIGGFRFFEKMMAVCIGVMFLTVITTAVMAEPNWTSVGRGICLPSIPAGGLGWVLGILGGVGGTVTLLSYGYWIKEEGRSGVNGMRACRVDLTVGYAMTALFGVAMIIIGSKVVVSGSGANVAPLLADQLGNFMGPSGRLIFLLGFWGAVFSSLLGVWQGVPYLFADFFTLRRGFDAYQRHAIDYTKTASYRAYLVAMSIIPLPILFLTVKKAQLAYAVLGSLFMPLLALTLLLMNNRRSWVGERFRNGWIPNAVLSLVLIFFAYVGFTQATKAISMLRGM